MSARPGFGDNDLPGRILRTPDGHAMILQGTMHETLDLTDAGVDYYDLAVGGVPVACAVTVNTAGGLRLDSINRLSATPGAGGAGNFQPFPARTAGSEIPGLFVRVYTQLHAGVTVDQVVIHHFEKVSVVTGVAPA